MANEDQDPTTDGPRSFARFTEQACSGSLHSDASNELHAMITKLKLLAMTRGGSPKGTFTLSVTVQLDAADATTAAITYSAKHKVPEPARRKGEMYVTAGGNLTPDNPRQRSLPLMEVPKTPRPMTDHRAEQGA